MTYCLVLFLLNVIGATAITSTSPSPNQSDITLPVKHDEKLLSSQCFLHSSSSEATNNSIMSIVQAPIKDSENFTFRASNGNYVRIDKVLYDKVPDGKKNWNILNVHLANISQYSTHAELFDAAYCCTVMPGLCLADGICTLNITHCVIMCICARRGLLEVCRSDQFIFQQVLQDIWDSYASQNIVDEEPSVKRTTVAENVRPVVTSKDEHLNELLDTDLQSVMPVDNASHKMVLPITISNSLILSQMLMHHSFLNDHNESRVQLSDDTFSKIKSRYFNRSDIFHINKGYLNVSIIDIENDTKELLSQNQRHVSPIITDKHILLSEIFNISRNLTHNLTDDNDFISKNYSRENYKSFYNNHQIQAAKQENKKAIYIDNGKWENNDTTFMPSPKFHFPSWSTINSCGLECINDGGRCVFDFEKSYNIRCVYDGTTACSALHCVHGTCQRYNNDTHICRCQNGWAGSLCNKACQRNCGTFGSCVVVDDKLACRCHINHTGELCDELKTMPVLWTGKRRTKSNTKICLYVLP